MRGRIGIGRRGMRRLRRVRSRFFDRDIYSALETWARLVLIDFDTPFVLMILEGALIVLEAELSTHRYS